jgi:uncharacterized protein YlzI (FlbEa/FlbD family)
MIKLTSHSSKLPILINETHIESVSIQVNSSRSESLVYYITTIHMSSGLILYVKETVEQIEELLNK